MYILAIETTGPLGSVAITDGAGNCSLKISGEEMNHLKDLMPMAQQLMDEWKLAKSDLSAVAASIGPGSFTGIRIGVSTARAVAQALNLPAISVPTLDMFKQRCDGMSLIVPIFNARRGQVYGGVFDEAGDDILRSGPYLLTEVFEAVEAHLEDVRSEMPCGMLQAASVKFYGDGVDAYAQELADFKEKMLKLEGCRVLNAPKDERYQDAGMTARAAVKKYRNGELISADQLLPDYMRVTEAEQKLKDGSLARERAAKMARFKAR